MGKEIKAHIFTIPRKLLKNRPDLIIDVIKLKIKKFRFDKNNSYAEFFEQHKDNFIKDNVTIRITNGKRNKNRFL